MNPYSLIEPGIASPEPANRSADDPLPGPDSWPIVDDEPTIDDTDDDIAARMREALGAEDSPDTGRGPSNEIDDEPTNEWDRPLYIGTPDAIHRLEVLEDGTIVVSGSSLEHRCAIVESGSEFSSPSERTLIPLFRKLVEKLGPGQVLTLLAAADRLNESASGEKPPPVREARPT